MKNFNPHSPALKHSQLSKLRIIASICVVFGALGFCNAAFAAADASAVQTGSQAAVKQAQNAGLVPTKDIPALFKRLGYEDPTIAAAAEVAEQMDAAGATLEKQNYYGILGAMVSNSRVDKSKVLKNTINNPAESFEALFGSNELSLENYEKVFDALNCKDYKKRVKDLGADTAKAWFGLFNATLRKMPAQNAYLLAEVIKATSTIYAYGNPAIKKPVSAAVVANATWRWMILVSDADFDVASLITGNTMDTATVNRIPSNDALQKVSASADLKLPPSLSDIPTRGTNDMVARVAQYLSGAQQDMRIEQSGQKAEQLGQKAELLGQENERIRQEIERIRQEIERMRQKAEQFGQKAEQLGQKAEQLGQENERMEKEIKLKKRTNNLIAQTNEVLEYFTVNLPKFVKMPKDAKLIESMKYNAVKLSDLKKQWIEIPDESTTDEFKKIEKYYSLAMKSIENIEGHYAKHI